jgi:gentisate 1,2-dioxygenase
LIESFMRGALIPFTDYLARINVPSRQPTKWDWREILEILPRVAPTERGALALAPAGPEGAASIAPGVSATVQVVQPGAATRPHAHSFWHVFVVMAGRGELRDTERLLFAFDAGDVFTAPPWCEHSLWNCDPSQPLVLLSLQNLPMLADCGGLARREPGEPIYAAGAQVGS